MRPVAITGVLVTGKTASRLPLAKRAVRSWFQQRYNAPRELLVINDHPTAKLFPDGPPSGVREICLTSRSKLGQLRNIGIKYSNTPYLVQWDDDDYSSPDRLAWQVTQTPLNQASILRYEIHCDLTTGEAFVNDGYSIRCGGFPGTMLWPAVADCSFPTIGIREDTEFVMRLQQTCGVAVLNNDPQLYSRFFTGHNTWGRKHVMHRKTGSRDLTPIEQAHITQLLKMSQMYLSGGDSAEAC